MLHSVIYSASMSVAKRKHLLTEVTSADAHRSAAQGIQYSVCKYSKHQHST